MDTALALRRAQRERETEARHAPPWSSRAWPCPFPAGVQPDTKSPVTPSCHPKTCPSPSAWPVLPLPGASSTSSSTAFKSANPLPDPLPSPRGFWPFPGFMALRPQVPGHGHPPRDSLCRCQTFARAETETPCGCFNSEDSSCGLMNWKPPPAEPAGAQGTSVRSQSDS